MATLITATNEVLLTPDEQTAASDFVRCSDDTSLRLTTEDGTTLPRELSQVLELVLDAMAAGRPVSVATMPEHLTTTAAAGLLGVSRPTLMKFIHDGRIPAHRVGSHHRLLSADVLTLRDELRAEREKAVFELLDLEDDLSSDNS